MNKIKFCRIEKSLFLRQDAITLFQKDAFDDVYSTIFNSLISNLIKIKMYNTRKKDFIRFQYIKNKKDLLFEESLVDQVNTVFSKPQELFLSLKG